MKMGASMTRPTIPDVGLTTEAVREQQRADTVVGLVLGWVERPETRPTPQELVMMDPEIQSLHAQLSTLEVREGILYRQFFKMDGTVDFYQIIAPRSIREAILERVHCDLTSGHMGQKKTEMRLKQYVWWSGWKRDVDVFVRRCPRCCQYRRGPRAKQGELQAALGCGPMQKVHLDLTGPHVRSCTQKTYLMTLCCAFTKYLVAVPIRDKTALCVAKALVERVYLVYGAVEILVHDGGKEFCNSLQEQLSKLMGIQMTKITPYRASANGNIERVHGTINRIFAKVIATNQKDWCQRAAFVAYAYNTAWHTSTLYSPFFLMFMRHPVGSLDWMLESPKPESTGDVHDFVQGVSERMRSAYAVVRQQLRCSFDRAKKRYDYRVKTTRFEQGMFVWHYSPRRRPGRGRKWQLATSGPFRVERKLSDILVVLRKTPTSKLFISHIDRLSRYEGEIPACWKSAESPSTAAGQGNIPACGGRAG